ncbi:phospholipase (plasmid) [Rhodobacteraceae bacterium SC52]|nr:phospholipase [Rhodobacteraceae bacterium SC52]
MDAPVKGQSQADDLGLVAHGIGANVLPDLHVMLTGHEAFPYLEQMFLTAASRIIFSFRMFDPETKLLSPAAREVGDSWADLVAHTLGRGVRITGTISDFDPIGAPELHRGSHRSLRLLKEAAEAAGALSLLDVDAHLHPAQAGLPYRLMLTPFARSELRGIARRLEAQGQEKCKQMLADSPALAPLLVRGGDGRLGPRRGRLPPLQPCTHHQKIAVADGRQLYIGGLDLDNRRRDDWHHEKAAGRTWHDVQLGLTGPVAASAESHLLRFRDQVAQGGRPTATPGLLRTLSRKRGGLGALTLGPEPMVREIFDRTVAEVGKAQNLIYLETQYLRDVQFAKAVAQRAADVPDLAMIVVLPAAPEEVAFLRDKGFAVRFGEHLQAKCFKILRRAFGDRLIVVAPAQPRGVAPDGSRAILCGAPIIYVHAKVSVVDGRFAIVSSANLNGRSHRWDTEAGVAIEDPAQVTYLRERLMRHWLPEDAGAEFLDPHSAPQAWHRLAQQNAEKPPAERRGFLLPYPEAVPRRFGRPIPFMPSDMV